MIESVVDNLVWQVLSECVKPMEVQNVSTPLKAQAASWGIAER